MNHKGLIIFLVVIILSVCAIRISYINIETRKYSAVDKEYQIGEEIPYESDYFFNKIECSNGYSIMVLDSSCMCVRDFREKMNIKDDSLFMSSDYVYLVRVKFKNNNSINNDYGEKTGINIRKMMLQNDAFISYPDSAAFMALNDFDYYAFSLSPGKEREFTIPFGINDDFIRIKKLIKNKTRLVISLYPNKKTVILQSVDIEKYEF